MLQIFFYSEKVAVLPDPTAKLQLEVCILIHLLLFRGNGKWRHAFSRVLLRCEGHDCHWDHEVLDCLGSFLRPQVVCMIGHLSN